MGCACADRARIIGPLDRRVRERRPAVRSRTAGRPFLALLAVVASPLASAAGASAATVTVRTVSIDPDYDPEPAVDYIAGAGEANDVLAVAVNGDRRVKISDPGAVITASGRC